MSCRQRSNETEPFFIHENHCIGFTGIHVPLHSLGRRRRRRQWQKAKPPPKVKTLSSHLPPILPFSGPVSQFPTYLQLSIPPRIPYKHKRTHTQITKPDSKTRHCVTIFFPRMKKPSSQPSSGENSELISHPESVPSLLSFSFSHFLKNSRNTLHVLSDTA